MQSDRIRSAVQVAARLSEMDEAEARLPASMVRVRRRKSRVERASDAGVWSAALSIAFVACLAPAWFLGAGLAFRGPADGTASFVLLSLGAGATWFGLVLCFTLSNAPRLGNGPHRSAMRSLAVVGGVLAIVLLHRLFSNGDELGSDPLAFVGALAPAVMLAETSLAIPAVARQRHGTAIGGIGALAWIATGGLVLLVWPIPAIWWLPLVASIVASACTALAAVRLWQHYEGEVVTA